jgi:ABC-type dipeptide/oligopeptide/nickel transport systems, permease components
VVGYPVIREDFIIASMVITINFIVDLLYAWANPRMRGRLSS